LAEIIQKYVTSGSKIYVEGRLQTRKWSHKDGGDRYATEIVVDQFVMLSGKQDGSETPTPAAKAKPVNDGAPFDDEIPF
jgi:single-strand DNA-binding protein